MSKVTATPVTKQDVANYPFVSVVTPTYNRRRFMSSLIACYKAQTYPKHRMEWIILDDGTDSVEDIFSAAEVRASIPNLRYIRLTEKYTIGAKRNRLNAEARGEIIVAMDDDDYYVPERVSAVVTAFKKQPRVQLAGSTEIYMYYTDIQTIYKLGPYNANHATNGTMAWRANYAANNTYDETVTHAEEKSFLNDYSNPMIQLDPMKVMLVMSHSENTFDKTKMREVESPVVKKTSMKLNQFIKDKALRDFFKDA